jgi:hypothetical protein
MAAHEAISRTIVEQQRAVFHFYERNPRLLVDDVTPRIDERLCAIDFCRVRMTCGVCRLSMPPLEPAPSKRRVAGGAHAAATAMEDAQIAELRQW